MTQALDICTHIGQRIQQIMMSVPRGHQSLIFDLVREVVDSLEGEADD